MDPEGLNRDLIELLVLDYLGDLRLHGCQDAQLWEISEQMKNFLQFVDTYHTYPHKRKDHSWPRKPG